MKCPDCGGQTFVSQPVETPDEQIIPAIEIILERIANALEALVRDLCTDKGYHEHD